MHYYIDFLYTYPSAKKDPTNEEQTETYKASTASGDEFHFHISELGYKKELYAPCHLRVEMNLLKNPNSPTKPDSIGTPDDFKKILLSSKVTLKVSGNKEVGEDYMVYDCRYKINYKTGETPHWFSLEIYSRDKLLDIHKFSHVYLNKKLGEHIIKRTLTKGKSDDTSHKGVPDLSKLNVQFNDNFIDNLQHTKFKLTTNEEVNGKEQDIPFYELIHPYRVQYNETFYSFISRLANRCGEFLFFEDGKLYLGILPKTAILTTADLSSIEYIQKNTEESDNLQVNAFYQNCFTDDIKENANKKSEENLYYNDDFSYDEFLEVISDTDDFMDSVKNEFSVAGWIDVAMSHFPSGLWISKANGSIFPYYAEYILNFVVLGAGRYVAESASNSAGANKIRKDYFFKDKDEDEVEDYCKDLQYTDKGADDHKERSQFGVLKKFADKASNLMAEFYDNIRKKEIESSHNIVRLHLNNFSNTPVKLGQNITVKDTGNNIIAKGYVVGIYCSYIPIDSVTYNENKFETIKKVIKEEVTVDVCQFSADNKIYPVYHKCREINRISAQSAIVADANDPLALGRVRIRYPWQDAAGSDSASPWIRMSVPLASKDHGRVFFKPNEDDEVMVDYINGNPEKPYVAGSLFHGKKSFSGSLRWPETSVIRSYNGQKLAFTEECASDFFSSLIGDPTITSNLRLVGDALGWDWLDAADQGALEFMHGRMTLTDKFGFWTISGDTGSRSISIKSKFGDVKIDAFTGITISAPNGDINIEGKNINITASNNINIEAGQAIKKDLDEYSWGAIGKDIFGEIIGSIDLSFFRCLWDAILPPITGTLKIKSYRNLFLEADTGTTWGKDSDVDVNVNINNINNDNAEKLNAIFALGDTLLSSMMACRNLQGKVAGIIGSINIKLATMGLQQLNVGVTTDAQGEWQVRLGNESYKVLNITYNQLFKPTNGNSEPNALFVEAHRNVLDTQISESSLQTLRGYIIEENANNANNRQHLVEVAMLFIQIQNLVTSCTAALLEFSWGNNNNDNPVDYAKAIYKQFVTASNVAGADVASLMKRAMAKYYLKCIMGDTQLDYKMKGNVTDANGLSDDDVKLLDKIEYRDQSTLARAKRFFSAADNLSLGLMDEFDKFTEEIRHTTISNQNRGGIRMSSSAYSAVELKDGKFEPIKGAAQFSDLDGLKALIKQKINSIK